MTTARGEQPVTDISWREGETVRDGVMAVRDGEVSVHDFDLDQLNGMRDEARRAVALALVEVRDDGDGLPFIEARTMGDPVVLGAVESATAAMVAIENEYARRLRAQYSQRVPAVAIASACPCGESRRPPQLESSRSSCQ